MKSANLIAVQNTCARQRASAHTHTHLAITLLEHPTNARVHLGRAQVPATGGGRNRPKKCRGEDHICAPTSPLLAVQQSRAHTTRTACGGARNHARAQKHASKTK